MKNGRLKELRLGLAAGNRFTVTISTVPSYPMEIKAVKCEKGVIKVNLGHGHRRHNDNWQPLAPGDVVRGAGEFAPTYKAEDLLR